MRFIINIGLDVEGTTTLQSDVALQIVKANGFIVHAHAVHQSDTEATLVAVVQPDPLGVFSDGGSVYDAFWCIAVDLRQDCIAVHTPLKGDGMHGTLIGPKSASWGRFDPSCFLQMNGTRLGAPVTA